MEQKRSQKESDYLPKRGNPLHETVYYIVHAPDKSSGHRRQKIELVWNFIGEVNLPGDDQTVERQRKGRAA